MEATPSGQPIIDREKTAPFLIRAFIKIGSFHRINLFEDSTLPTTDEHQIFTWKDATLREVLTTLRASHTPTPELRHPLARYSFRAVYADAAARGRFATKELGLVYSRDILGEPGSLEACAPRLRDEEPVGREDRTLEELRFVPGDYMCVAVLLPKNVAAAAAGGEVSIKGAAGEKTGWKKESVGWGAPVSTTTGPGRGAPGGGHWRGDSNPPPPSARGTGRGRGGGRAPSRERDIERDRRVPPPRRERDREEPPHRGYRGGPPGRSRSPSRTPPRRRRYD